MDNFRLFRLGAVSVIAVFASSIPAYAANTETTLSLESGERIEVVATIVGGHGRHRLTLQKEGNAAALVAANADRHFVRFGERPRMDVTVKVPSTLRLEVRDGPGEIALENMQAPANVIDESGDLSVKRHRGDLKIYDGAGGIKIEDIAGDIYVLDGAGHLSLKKVAGNVDINDGIGSIVVKDIDGHVSIHDGRGGVAVANITRGLTVNDGRTGQLAMTLVEAKD